MTSPFVPVDLNKLLDEFEENEGAVCCKSDYSKIALSSNTVILLPLCPVFLTHRNPWKCKINSGHKD